MRKAGDVRLDLATMHSPPGREARDALWAIVGREPMTCRAVDRDRYGRIVAEVLADKL